MKRFLLAGVAGLLISAGPAGADLLVQFEWIEVPHERLTALLATPALVADGTKLRSRLQELVAKEKASIYDTAILSVRPGQAAVAESHREWIFPAEAEPPTLPSQVGGTNGLGTGTTKGNPLTRRVPQTPSAFEAANVGAGVEVEAEPGEELGFISLRFAAEQGRVTRILEHGKRVIPNGTEDAFRIPEIEKLRTGGIVMVSEGAYVMAGVLARADAPENRLLLMVRCDVLE